MINALFLVAWVVIICVVLLTSLMIVKGVRIWLECKSFEDQAKQIHNQSAHYLSQDLKRLTPEEFYRQYRGKL